MNSVNLYHVQDSDRPMWVAAPDWTEALRRWKACVAAENNQKLEEVEDCAGISLICKANDFIVEAEPDKLRAQVEKMRKILQRFISELDRDHTNAVRMTVGDLGVELEDDMRAALQ